MSMTNRGGWLIEIIDTCIQDGVMNGALNNRCAGAQEKKID